MIRVITHALGYRAFTHARNDNRVITHALWITSERLSCYHPRSFVLSHTLYRVITHAPIP